MYAECDYTNLRIAAREFFEEGWAFKKTSALRGQVANREAVEQKSMPKRTLAEGYYSWIEYLSWLAALHDVAKFDRLTAAEAIGLTIISGARDEFCRRHPRCPGCGAMNEKFAMRCCDCKRELK